MSILLPKIPSVKSVTFSVIFLELSGKIKMLNATEYVSKLVINHSSLINKLDCNPVAHMNGAMLLLHCPVTTRLGVGHPHSGLEDQP